MPDKSPPRHVLWLVLLLLAACNSSQNTQQAITKTPWQDRPETIAATELVTGRNYLSDLPWFAARNGWGPVERDRANSHVRSSLSGQSLHIAETSFSKGLAVFAASTVEYDIGGLCSQFSTYIGVDKYSSTATVVFELYGDDVLLWSSATVTQRDRAQRVELNILDVNNLVLRVSDAGDGNDGDAAIWGGAYLECDPSSLLSISEPPTDLKAVFTAAEVLLSWQAVANAKSYLIERKSDGEEYHLLAESSDSHYSDATVSPNHHYSYRVRGINAAGAGDAAEVVISTLNTEPTLPTGFSAQAESASEIRLAWMAADLAEFYVLERSTDTAFAELAVLTELEYLDSSVSSNSIYQYRLRAVNSIGSSGLVQLEVGTPGDIPGNIANLTGLAPSFTRIVLSWQALDTAENYRVERLTEDGFEVVAHVTESSFTDDNLQPGQTYYYRVRGVNSFGIGAARDISVSIPSATPEPVNQFRSTTVTTSRVELTWDSSQNAVSYLIQRRGPGEAFSPLTESGSLSFADNNVQPGLDYSYRIRGVNQFAAGEWRSLDVSTPGIPPEVPGNLALNGVSTTDISLSWSAAARATTYRLERRVGSANYAVIATPASTSFTDRNLQPGTVYRYRLTALNAFGESSSLELEAGTEGFNPSRLTDLSAQVISTREIRLNWSPATNASSYVVERRTPSSTFHQLATLAVTSYVDRSVAPNTSYIYRVFAVNEHGPGAAAELRTGTPFADLQAGSTAMTQGYWSAPIPWPLIGLHASLLPSGQVLTFGTKVQAEYDGLLAFYYDIWNPAAGTGLGAHTTLANTTNTNIFCGAQALLPDGRLLIVGGDDNTSRDKGPNRDMSAFTGSHDLNIFDYRSTTLTPSPLQMLRGRWYPTLTMLPSGEVLAQGGLDIQGFPTITPEVWNAAQGWRLLSEATSSALYTNGWYYPYSFVAPNGRVFIAGRQPDMWWLDTQGTGQLHYAGRRDTVARADGSAVMFDRGRILVVGGGERAVTNTAVVIDVSGNSPIVTPTSSMSVPRKFLDATLLFDGQVFVNGGSRTAVNEMSAAVYHSEIWNPQTGQWTQGASASRARLYHSTALLLPDGRVLVTGGDRPIEALNFNAEIYYPPYLFRQDGSGLLATRPLIQASPDRLSYNQSFFISTPDALDISRVSLVALGQVTHSFDQNQRFLSLDISSRSNSSLSVRSPENANLAPPGFYMLTILNSQGVPAVARIVSIQ